MFCVSAEGRQDARLPLMQMNVLLSATVSEVRNPCFWKKFAVC